MNLNVTNRSKTQSDLLAVLHQFVPEADFNQIPDDKPLRDYLDIDSIDTFNVLLGIHKKFGIEIPESDYGKVLGRTVTLNDIMTYIELNQRQI